MSLDRLASRIEQRFGLDLSPSRRERELVPRLEQRAMELGVGHDAYVERALLDDDELWALAERISNGWTWFLRDEAQLCELIERWAREPSRPRTAWVAGCSTGEEAYGLVMLGLERGIDVRVVGTDLDRGRLETARQGVYGDWSLRNLAPDRRARWFEDVGAGRFRVREVLRNAVALRAHNLMEVPPWMARHDAVLCRNVLIHCAEPAIARIGQHLELALTPGGELVLGASDALPWQAARRSSRIPPPLAPATTTTAPTPRADDFAASLTLGHLLVETHSFERAEAAYARAAAVEPDAPELHVALGVLHRKRGQWERAAAALRRAVFLDETLWPAWALLAGCLARLDEMAASAVARERGARARRLRPRIAWRSCMERILPLDAVSSWQVDREDGEPRGG
jgi:chemotaxis protein methyltransferase CheR